MSFFRFLIAFACINAYRIYNIKILGKKKRIMRNVCTIASKFGSKCYHTITGRYNFLKFVLYVNRINNKYFKVKKNNNIFFPW